MRIRVGLVSSAVLLAVGGCRWSEVPANSLYACASGMCPSGFECRAGFCHPVCVPDSCASIGRSCGEVSDGCGGKLRCGTCTAPQTCGGGAQSMACGCTPVPVSAAAVCADAGVSCGQLMRPDSCGALRSVGCGIACTGCTPFSQAETDFYCHDAGHDCGQFQLIDGCGVRQTLSCGTCTGAKVCVTDDFAGRCTPCGPEDDFTFCDRNGANCGQVSGNDSCGGARVVDCGSCATGCGDGGQPNQCFCQPNLSGCTDGQQCCSGTCGGGDRCCVGAGPGEPGCTDDSDCCKGVCAQGRCSLDGGWM